MHAIRSFALLLFAVANMAWAQADLQVISSASPTTGLALGQNVLVTTTIRNNGPDAAVAGSAGVFGEGQEGFYFQLVGSETPGCAITFLDFNPPIFNYLWDRPALAAGQEYTCVARLRVFNLPDDDTARLFAEVSAGGDPAPGNNTATLSFFFGTFASTARHTIPTTSIWGLTTLGLGALVLAAFACNRGRA